MPPPGDTPAGRHRFNAPGQAGIQCGRPGRTPRGTGPGTRPSATPVRPRPAGVPRPSPSRRSASRTAGSRASSATGTSNPASGPETIVAGWWSPSITTTGRSSPWVSTNDTSASSEYSTAPAYAARTRSGSGQMSASEASLPGMPSKTDPSPTSAGGTIRGIRDHGAWLVIRSISAITGVGRRAPARGGGRRRGCTGRAWSGSRTAARGSRRCASRRRGDHEIVRE